MRERISRRAVGDDRTSSLRLLQNYRWCLPSSQPPPPPPRLVPSIVVWASSRESASSQSQSQPLLVFFIKNLQTYNTTLYFETSIVQSNICPTAKVTVHLRCTFSSTRSFVSDNFPFFVMKNKISSPFVFPRHILLLFNNLSDAVDYVTFFLHVDDAELNVT